MTKTLDEISEKFHAIIEVLDDCERHDLAKWLAEVTREIDKAIDAKEAFGFGRDGSRIPNGLVSTLQIIQEARNLKL